jgi:ribosomal protein S1
MSEQNIIENGQTFEEMVEGYIDEVRTGKVLTGNVVRITEEGVFVDIGAKAEGMIPITEFTNDPNYEQDQVNLQYTLFISRTYFRT